MKLWRSTLAASAILAFSAPVANAAVSMFPGDGGRTGGSRTSRQAGVGAGEHGPRQDRAELPQRPDADGRDDEAGRREAACRGRRADDPAAVPVRPAVDAELEGDDRRLDERRLPRRARAVDASLKPGSPRGLAPSTGQGTGSASAASSGRSAATFPFASMICRASSSRALAAPARSCATSTSAAAVSAATRRSGHSTASVSPRDSPDNRSRPRPRRAGRAHGRVCFARRSA